jgi:hypothetical protein
VQLLNTLELGQLMRLAQTILELLVGVVLRRIRDEIQHGAEALLGQGVDDVVEHLLLVVHPLDAEPGLGDGKPGLRVLRPKLRQAERGASVVRLLVIHCRGSPM